MNKRIELLLFFSFLLIFPSSVFAAKTHKVKKQETLSSLAKKYHVTVDDLKSSNNIVHNHIKKGDVLTIPARSENSDSQKERLHHTRSEKGMIFQESPGKQVFQQRNWRD